MSSRNGQRRIDHMRKRIGAIITTGGAAAVLALTLGTASSSAAIRTTWSVHPGGSIKVAGSAQVKDAKTGTVAKCKTIKLAGKLKSGSGLSGTGIGKATSASFSGCTIATISVNVAVHGLPWKVNALSYDSKTGTTTGSITGIDLKATAPGCTATLDGTKAGADNGKTKFTYTNSTGKLKLLGAGGNLHSWNVSGCLGLVRNGDPQKASGSTILSPKQKVTSP
jgi:hypothetical protein